MQNLPSQGKLLKFQFTLVKGIDNKVLRVPITKNGFYFYMISRKTEQQMNLKNDMEGYKQKICWH